MVHNLPLFFYQAKLSPIQTNLPACSNAICGQNLELCSIPASINILELCKIKPFFSGQEPYSNQVNIDRAVAVD